ncbi:MAG: protoheme IX farnesyltransferase [Dehalococcoidia bacterium]|nr:protoheme IX farnesyltransferase [Dehalococcoidia bacterium]
MGRASVIQILTAYVQLTKPRIILSLLITTVPAMVLAAGGWPDTGLVVATLVGGTMAAGGANAINMYVDRDIDQIMGRTQGRPLPSGRVRPEQALIFGAGLGVTSFVLMTVAANMLSAALALFGLLFYVFVYTLWLKRSTPQNIVIGGAAGAMPPLVGWAAVTGDVGLPAIIMFGIIFVWTPPHFWALALNLETDYARAGVPMMPVVAGEASTRRQILVYAFILVALTLLLLPFADVSYFYLGSALTLGAIFIYLSYRLWRAPTRRAAQGLFAYSLVYLALLFTAVAVDTVISRV